MENFARCWLLVNPSSGTNDERTQLAVEEGLTGRGITVERTFHFPDDELPRISDLDEAGIELLAVFTGDGTLNAALEALAGWSGSVLVLPGGTMNLLARRLHRELTLDQILDLVAGGGAVSHTITVARCDAGIAYAGLLVGPGTCWAEVREAMREVAIAEVASGAIEAFRETANGPPVLAPRIPIARDDGYKLVELSPGEHGIEINGYYAREALDVAEQAWATIRRRFREGPHDKLGIARDLVLESADGSTLPCLIDGEPAECPSGSVFEVAQSEVKLLATSHDH